MNVSEPSTTQETPELRVCNVVTGYEESEVLHGISMRSHEGITCVFGPNGSGKSTLLKTMNGVVPVWSGTITCDGVTLHDKRPEDIVKQGLITQPQGGGLFQTLTLEENLRLGAFLETDEDTLDRRMQEVLEVFPELKPKLHQKTRELSGGQRTMGSLGRAMMSGGHTFLLDEPSAGLAPSLVQKTLQLIQRLVEQGARVVLVEQNVRSALRIADYVYILAEGEVKFSGPPGELSDETELVELYLGIHQSAQNS